MLQRRADGGKHISTASHIRQEIIGAGDELILVRPPVSIPIHPKYERGVSEPILVSRRTYIGRRRDLYWSASEAI